jgi:hypothetical protein
MGVWGTSQEQSDTHTPRARTQQQQQIKRATGQRVLLLYSSVQILEPHAYPVEERLARGHHVIRSGRSMYEHVV